MQKPVVLRRIFIDKLPDLNVDIVLMDIGLPGMSGIECVLKVYRKTAASPIL